VCRRRSPDKHSPRLKAGFFCYSLCWGILTAEIGRNNPPLGGCEHLSPLAKLEPSTECPLIYTVILVAGVFTQPVSTLEADNVEEARKKAEDLYPRTELALVVDEDD